MQMRMIIGIISIYLLGVAVLVGVVPSARAGESPDGARVYLEPAAYVQQVLGSHPGEQKVLWPDRTLRQSLKDILGHTPSLRFKYWGVDGKTVWVLDEIGKDRPITAGITISQGRIEDVQVLVFRESRGWEIKHDFFTRQFASLWLDAEQNLSSPVDNITGATLSVKAMTRMARAALLMHQHTPHSSSTLAHAR